MISEFKLIAFASMIYVLLDHFGGLRLVEKSLKNSGSNMILLGKASFIIVLLIVFQKLMKQFKILEGQTNRDNIENEASSIFKDGGGLLEILDFADRKDVQKLGDDLKKYHPMETCYDMIKIFNPNKIEETLLCIKLRLISGSECEIYPEVLSCLEDIIIDNLDEIDLPNNDVFKTINSERNIDSQSLSIFITNKNLDRIMLKLKTNEEEDKQKEEIVNIIEKILYDQSNIHKALTDEEIDILEKIQKQYKE